MGGDGAARPRSWCSCARPRRSGFSIIIRLELGTSTPTSITVVATSRCISPCLKACITVCFSAGFIRPWTRPILSSGSASLSSSRWLPPPGFQQIGLFNQRTDPIGRRPSGAGVTYAVDNVAAARVRDSDGRYRVRPGGSSSITEVSRSA